MRPSLIAALVTSFAFTASVAEAQEATAPVVADHVTESPSAPPPDYLFAHAGGFSGAFASGLPFLGVGELTYGVTSRVSVGLFGAATPDLPGVNGTLGIGLRPRAVLYQSGHWRATLVVPIIGYPQVKGFGTREPWMLTRPTAALEYELASGLRLNAGMGLLGAACTRAIFSFGKQNCVEFCVQDMNAGLWNTVAIGGAYPISKRVSAFGEASLIMNGVVPATNWLGGTPVIAFGGLAMNF